MSLGKTLRVLHEARLKEIRDKNACEDYIRNEGRNEGERRLNSLNLTLISDKRYDDIEKAARDEDYREKLYREYGI